MTPATKRAIEAVGSRRLASELGISRQAVEQWDAIPPRHVLRVEELSGVSRYDLRPDIYGEPPRRRSAKGNAPSVASQAA